MPDLTSFAEQAAIGAQAGQFQSQLRGIGIAILGFNQRERMAAETAEACDVFIGMLATLRRQALGEQLIVPLKDPDVS